MHRLPRLLHSGDSLEGMIALFTLIGEWMSGEHRKPGSMWNTWFGGSDGADGETPEDFTCPNCGFRPEQGWAEGEFAVTGWTCEQCGYTEQYRDTAKCKDCGMETLPEYLTKGRCGDCAEGLG